MSIEQLGNIGESVGAILILATLVFLAVQIRAQNSIAKADGHRDLIKQLADLHNRMNDGSTADIFVCGSLNFESLKLREKIL